MVEACEISEFDFLSQSLTSISLFWNISSDCEFCSQISFTIIDIDSISQTLSSQVVSPPVQLDSIELLNLNPSTRYRFGMLIQNCQFGATIQSELSSIQSTSNFSTLLFEKGGTSLTLTPSSINSWSSINCLTNIQLSSSLFGSSASCDCISSEKLCRIGLSSDSSISVGSWVDFIPSLNESVVVEAPNGGFDVNLVISAPSNISVCTSSFTLDGSSSSLPGSSSVNPTTFYWDISHSPSLLSSSLNTSSTPQLVVSNYSFPSSGILSFEMRVENDNLNVSEFIQGEVFVVEDEGLVILSGSDVICSAFFDCDISISASKFTCDDGEQSTSSLVYSWSSDSSSLTTQILSSTSSSSLSIPSFTLSPDESYQLEVSTNEGGSVNLVVDVLEAGSPVGVLIGGSRRSVLNDSSLSVVINGSLSYDPNICAPLDPGCDSSLVYSWSCFESSSFDPCPNLDVSSEISSILSASSHDLFSPSWDDVVVALTVFSEFYGKSYLVSIDLVSVNPVSSSTVQFETDPLPERIAGGNAPVFIDTNGENPVIEITDEETQQIVFYSIQPSTIASLLPGTYTIRTKLGGQFTEKTVVVNREPSGGEFLMSPSSGEEVETRFQASTFGWSDSEGDLPLSFRFFSLLSGERYDLTTSLSSSSLSDISGCGDGEFVVVVSDSLGAEVSSFSSIPLSSPVSSGNEASYVSSLSDISSSPNGIQCASSLLISSPSSSSSSVAAISNLQSHFTIKNQERNELTEGTEKWIREMIGCVSDSWVIIQASISQNVDIDYSLVESSMNCFSNLTSNRLDQVDNTTCENHLGVLESWLNSSQSEDISSSSDPILLSLLEVGLSDCGEGVISLNESSSLVDVISFLSFGDVMVKSRIQVDSDSGHEIISVDVGGGNITLNSSSLPNGDVVNIQIINTQSSSADMDSDIFEISITTGEKPSYSRCNKWAGNNDHDCATRNYEVQPEGDFDLSISHKDDQVVRKNVKGRECRSLEGEVWFSDGCETIESSDSSTSCRCNHMTAFAIASVLGSDCASGELSELYGSDSYSAFLVIIMISWVGGAVMCVTYFVKDWRKKNGIGKSNSSSTQSRSSKRVGGDSSCLPQFTIVQLSILILLISSLIRLIHSILLIYGAFEDDIEMACWELAGEGGSTHDMATILTFQSLFYPFFIFGLTAVGMYWLDLSISLASKSLGSMKKKQLMSNRSLAIWTVINLSFSLIYLVIQAILWIALDNENVSRLNGITSLLLISGVILMGVGYGLFRLGGTLVEALENQEKVQYKIKLLSLHGLVGCGGMGLMFVAVSVILYLIVDDVTTSSYAIPLFVINGVFLKIFECYGCLMFIYTLGFVSKPPSEMEDGDKRVRSMDIISSFRNLFISTSISKMEAEYYSTRNTTESTRNPQQQSVGSSDFHSSSVFVSKKSSNPTSDHVKENPSSLGVHSTSESSHSLASTPYIVSENPLLPQIHDEKEEEDLESGLELHTLPSQQPRNEEDEGGDLRPIGEDETTSKESSSVDKPTYQYRRQSNTGANEGKEDESKKSKHGKGFSLKLPQGLSSMMNKPGTTKSHWWQSSPSEEEDEKEEDEDEEDGKDNQFEI